MNSTRIRRSPGRTPERDRSTGRCSAQRSPERRRPEPGGRAFAEESPQRPDAGAGSRRTEIRTGARADLLRGVVCGIERARPDRRRPRGRCPSPPLFRLLLRPTCAFQPLPFVMWLLVYGHGLPCLRPTIWGRRWSVQADLDPGGEYGLSPRELAILADKEASPLPLIGAGVASLIDKGVVYRPPGGPRSLSRAACPTPPTTWSGRSMRRSPGRTGFPLEVSRHAEPFLREIVRRLREQGMYVSESRYSTRGTSSSPPGVRPI